MKYQKCAHSNGKSMIWEIWMELNPRNVNKNNWISILLDVLTSCPAEIVTCLMKNQWFGRVTHLTFQTYQNHQRSKLLFLAFSFLHDTNNYNNFMCLHKYQYFHWNFITFGVLCSECLIFAMKFNGFCLSEFHRAPREPQRASAIPGKSQSRRETQRAQRERP